MQEKGHSHAQNDPSVEYIYTSYITLRNGHRLYAKAYGLKAFCIPVRICKQ